MNKIFISGHLTKSPELRYTANQKVVATFTLAVDRPFLNKDGVKEADFIPVVVWGKTAEVVNHHCTKGQKLLVEGRVQVRSYEDKSGEKRWMTEVVGDKVEFLERKSASTDSYANPNDIPF